MGPQRSILGPFIFTLYVSDLQNLIKCSRYQYADDTTFFVHSKTKDVANDVVELNDAISRLGDYSSESNIALNEAKTNKVDACFHPPDVIELTRYTIIIQLWAYAREPREPHTPV